MRYRRRNDEATEGDSRDWHWWIEKVAVPIVAAAIGAGALTFVLTRALGNSGTTTVTAEATKTEDLPCLASSRVYLAGLPTKPAQPLAAIEITPVSAKGTTLKLDHREFTDNEGSFFVECERFKNDDYPIYLNLSRDDWHGCVLRTREPFLRGAKDDLDTPLYYIPQRLLDAKSGTQTAVFMKVCAQ